MIPVFSMRGWRRLAGLMGFSLVLVVASCATAAEATNAAKIEPRKFREDLIKNRLQNDMFRKWGSAQDSLGGFVLPPVSRPSLSPAQARELKETLAEQRYWMFTSPDDAGNASSVEERFKMGRSAPGLLDGLDAGTPRVLQRYYDRQSGRRNETNNAAQDDGEFRDGLSSKFDERRTGKSARSKAGEMEIRPVFQEVETAASRAISRLFQPNGGRELEVKAGGGLFSDIFKPPASIPMERSVETMQRRSDFQKLLDAPKTSPMGNSFSPLPVVTPVASGFGGLNNFAPRPASGLSGAAGGSSLLGASSAPAVVLPARSGFTQFEPVSPPKRRF